MVNVITATLPIFLLILLGWLFKRSTLLQPQAWSSIERLTYFVLFPCLLATTLAQSPFGQMAIGHVAAALALAIGTVSIALLLLQRFLFADGPRFTSVYQGSVRMNTYIGLSIAAALYGKLGLSAAALAMAIIVPIVNITCVLVLAWYGSAARRSLMGILGAWLKNPLIIGSFVGIALNITGWGMPPIVGSMAEILGKAALPMGLLAVGAALNLQAVQAAQGLVLVTSMIKLIALPLITYGMLQVFDATGIEASIAVLFSALPTATSSYILASQYGGDAGLMASLISVQTLLSMLTLPAVIAYLM